MLHQKLRLTEAGPPRDFSVTVATEEVEVCDLCGGKVFAFERTSPDLVERLVAGEHAYVRCLRCRLCFLSPRPTPAEIAKVYPADYEPHAGGALRRPVWWQRLAGRRGSNPSWFTRWLISLCQRQAVHTIAPWTGGGRILDVGCGGGAFLDTMKQLGWETHGRDPSPQACEAAAEKGHRVGCGTAADLDDPPERYDVVYLNHVLEHTSSPRETLARLREALKPGGWLVMAVPNYGGLQKRLVGRYSSALDPPRHLYQFERRTLRRYLYAAGFRDVEITTRTGARSVTKALRLLINDLLGTSFRREPAWLSVPFELTTVICGLFGFFGAGRDLRAVARR